MLVPGNSGGGFRIDPENNPPASKNILGALFSNIRANRLLWGEQLVFEQFAIDASCFGSFCWGSAIRV